MRCHSTTFALVALLVDQTPRGRERGGEGRRGGREREGERERGGSDEGDREM